LAFFDAIAPVVSDDSLDHGRLYALSRYGKGEGDDYLNAPMDGLAYDRFLDALLEADQHQGHDFDQVPYFEGCLPVEEMARRADVELGRLSDPAPDSRAAARVPHDTGPRAGRVSALRQHPSEFVPQQPREPGPGPHRARRRPALLRRPDHRRRGVHRIARHRPPRGDQPRPPARGPSGRRPAA